MCRQAERKWKKDHLQVSSELFRDRLVAYQKAVKTAKANFLSNLVSCNAKNPQFLFKTLNGLVNPCDSSGLVPSPKLCEDFMEFFNEKINSIRACLVSSALNNHVSQTCHATFDTFEPVSLSILTKIVHKVRSSFCPVDIIPPGLLKEVFESIGLCMVHLINSSFKSGCVPVDFKHAVVQPLLKKPNLDPTTLANFRPISKLPFLSKVLEKAVYEQLQSYIDQNTIAEKFQSGFKSCHSTETALLRVFNDLFLTADSGGHSVLVLLDLTAAFDTVDHGILLSRLELSVGLKGTVLKWFDSYLKDRSFSVNVGSCFSSVSPIHCGVPQGSILGPLLFSLYLLPLGLILEKHKVGYHFYADDLQIYMPLKSSSKGSLNPLLDCIQEVKLWMEANFLSLNKDKTEILIFGNSDSNVLDNCDSAIGPLASFCHPFARN
uniref:Reverse transcriptase domain-containing protein n=1 Tax=Neogobius melanostomus TaxID=47308 RepID=A0A8C6TX04_9GOBI